MKLKVLDSGKLNWRVFPGDTFNLKIDGKEVHSQKIDKEMNLRYWALIAFGHGQLGYCIGDDNLIVDLNS